MNTYIDGKVTGVSGSKVLSEIVFEREDPILARDDGIKEVAVERFLLHNVVLPLYSNTKTLVIRLVGASTYSATVNFSSLVDSNGFLYDYRDFATAISNALTSVCASAGEVNVPTFTFNASTNLFSINSVSAFRSAWTLQFNYALYWLLPTFDYSSSSGQVFDDVIDTWDLILNSDTVTQSNSCLEFLSPLDVILIKSIQMPVAEELTPAPVGANIISNNSTSYLMDFKYIQSNNQFRNTITYNSLENDKRFHDIVKHGDIKKFSIRFQWADYDGNVRDIYLGSNSIAKIKLYFRK